MSSNSTLLVQGSLEAVTNFTVSTKNIIYPNLTISWSAPFSLDLTTADPDIQYCVDVYNATGGGSHLLDSVCGITDTQYTYTAPDPTGVFKITVTPRSNIQGSLNGTTSQPAEFCYTIPVDFDFVTNVQLSPLLVIFRATTFSSCENSPEYLIMIQSIDEENSMPCNCSTGNLDDTPKDRIVLELDCNQCDIRRHERYYMTLIETEYWVQSEPKIISTHDIFEVRNVIVPVENQVEIVSEYLLNSTDEGFFAIIHSQNHTLYRVVRRNGNELSTNLTVSGLMNDVYRVAVYDLTDDNYHGFLQPNLDPAVVSEEEVNNSRPMGLNVSVTSEPPTITSSIDPIINKNGSICMMCFSPGLSGCVGVIHSAPLDTYNLTVLTARAGEENCTSEKFQGELSVAVFDVRMRGLEEFSSYQVEIDLSTNTTNEVPTDIATLTDAQIIVIVSIGIIIILLTMAILIIAVALFMMKTSKRKVGDINRVVPMRAV